MTLKRSRRSSPSLFDLADDQPPSPPGSEGVALHEGVAGVRYYDNLSIENALNPQTMLAYEMNDQPLGVLHGAPLRLRVENQLGFKMVKWIRAIGFVEDVSSIGQGEGGFAEDHEYFGDLANI